MKIIAFALSCEEEIVIFGTVCNVFPWRNSVLRVWKVSSPTWSWSRSRLCSWCWFFVRVSIYVHVSKPEGFKLPQNLYVLSEKYRAAAVVAPVVTGASLAPQRFLFICSPHRAGLIIWRRMHGLLCITVFWWSFSSFFQVLFRMIAIYYSRLFLYRFLLFGKYSGYLLGYVIHDNRTFKKNVGMWLLTHSL